MDSSRGGAAVSDYPVEGGAVCAGLATGQDSDGLGQRVHPRGRWYGKRESVSGGDRGGGLSGRAIGINPNDLGRQPKPMLRGNEKGRQPDGLAQNWNAESGFPTPRDEQSDNAQAEASDRGRLRHHH